ncbi:MAG: DNA repair protein RecO [Porticoccaceae bacterium]|nr:MAG: DNA repair protein RecO [Porticoccaceae bacterium]
MSAIDLGYVLHARPWRETSTLLTVFCREAGRAALLAKGVRRRRGRALEPFCLFEFAFGGRGELKTLRSAEILEVRPLAGEPLFLGLYANELLVRTVREGQSYPPLFDRYHHFLRALEDPTADREALLRSFEFCLLEQLGYGFSLEVDAEGRALVAEGWYRFEPQRGLVAAFRTESAFPGRHLLAIAAMDFRESEVRRAAKRLLRQALAPLLGTRPLVSRELYRALRGGA